MSKQALAAPTAGAGPPAGAGPTSPAHAKSPQPTPHRPVVFLALALFLPALWLVLIGNLSVQTALVRFMGALLVSWFAARFVIATAYHSTGSAASKEGVGTTSSPANPAGPAGSRGSGANDPPDDTTSASVT